MKKFIIVAIGIFFTSLTSFFRNKKKKKYSYTPRSSSRTEIEYDPINRYPEKKKIEEDYREEAGGG